VLILTTEVFLVDIFMYEVDAEVICPGSIRSALCYVYRRPMFPTDTRVSDGVGQYVLS